MDMTQKQVEKLAHLARLCLSQQEQEELTKQLEQVVAYMQVLAQVPGEAEGALEGPCVLREDKVHPVSCGDKLLDQAPQRREGYVVTPKSVGEGGTA